MEEPFIHETSLVDEGVVIGQGTKIWHFCHIMPGAQLGEKCTVGQNVFIAAQVKIGNGVKIQNNVSVYSGVVLEDDVFLGPSMVFTNVDTPRSQVDRSDRYQTTVVKKGATIGANATIICGITLGEYSFVGAGAVVTGDVPPYALVYGNPARLQGWMCQCGERLTFQQEGDAMKAVCHRCQKIYQTDDGQSIEPIDSGVETRE